MTDEHTPDPNDGLLGERYADGSVVANDVVNDELTHEQREVAGLSQMQLARRRFFRHKGAMISLILLTFIVVMAITSVGAGPIPGWWKYDHTTLIPSSTDQGPTLSLPTWLSGSGLAFGEHPFGIDNERGRDLFAQTMRGTQVSLAVIVVLAVISVTLGVGLGALAGYFGGWIDAIIMRVTDTIIILPLLVLVSVFAFQFKWAGVWSVAITLGLFSWTGLCRLVRAEFLTLREREFVDAARVAGASNRRIIFKHIAPNTIGTVIVSVTLLMGAGILTEAALSFLGFGINDPDVSLGSLVQLYQSAFGTRSWLFIFPGVMIVSIVLCLQFIGDGLRDAFDPRQKRIPKFKDLQKKAEAGES